MEAEVNGRGGTTREVRAHAPPTAFSGTAVENNGVVKLMEFLLNVFTHKIDLLKSNQAIPSVAIMHLLDHRE